MNISKKLVVASILLLVITLQGTWAQIFSSGVPLYNPVKDTLFVPRIVIENTGVESTEKSSGTLFKDDKFAEPIDVSFSPDDYGVWVEKTQENKKIWLLAIKVKNASSLNLILEPFYLEEGSKLFFYDSLQTNIVGAITSRNNKKSGVLPISGISDSLIYCELQVPVFQENYGDFTISRIGAGYKQETSLLKTVNDSYYGLAAYCNVNVNCYDFEGLSNQKRSVCRIVYLGTTRCTGTLLNNLGSDGTPYVLTAGHCINTQSIAEDAIFYFNFESPGCEDSLVSPVSVSGSDFVSAGYHIYGQHDSLDFSLLKLTETPPLDYNVYYSGWDATGDIVDSTYTIHHPQGDIKKISLNDDPVEVSSFGAYFLENTHFRIDDYEAGTTEGGSSGSGLINYNGKLIGTLSGGSSEECPEYIYDKYQQFSYAYDYYNDTTYQLKHWLDPANKGSQTCPGYDPSFYYREYAQALMNYDTLAEQYAFQQEEGWGYLAGHNYQGNKLFFEKYEMSGSKYLVGAGMYLAQAASTSSGQYVNFQIREAGDQPGDIIYEQKLLISDYEDVFKRFPDTLFLIEFDSTIFVDKGFYFGYEITYQTDTFALKTYTADASDNTAYTQLGNSWSALLLDGYKIPSHLAMHIYAFDLNVEKGEFPDTATWGKVRVYPNPVYDGYLHLYFSEAQTGSITVKLINTEGKIISEQKLDDYGKNTQISLEVEPGVYVLQVWGDDGLIKTQKIVSL